MPQTFNGLIAAWEDGAITTDEFVREFMQWHAFYMNKKEH